MKRSVRMLLEAMNAVDLPSVVIRDKPRITLEADTNVYVENHGGICSFTQEEITVYTSMGLLYIEGTDLKIEQMDRDRIRIRGKIGAEGHRREK